MNHYFVYWKHAPYHKSTIPQLEKQILQVPVPLVVNEPGGKFVLQVDNPSLIGQVYNLLILVHCFCSKLSTHVCSHKETYPPELTLSFPATS